MDRRRTAPYAATVPTAGRRAADGYADARSTRHIALAVGLSHPAIGPTAAGAGPVARVLDWLDRRRACVGWSSFGSGARYGPSRRRRGIAVNITTTDAASNLRGEGADENAPARSRVGRRPAAPQHDLSRRLRTRRPLPLGACPRRGDSPLGAGPTASPAIPSPTHQRRSSGDGSSATRSAAGCFSRRNGSMLPAGWRPPRLLVEVLDRATIRSSTSAAVPVSAPAARGGGALPRRSTPVSPRPVWHGQERPRARHSQSRPRLGRATIVRPSPRPRRWSCLKTPPATFIAYEHATGVASVDAMVEMDASPGYAPSAWATSDAWPWRTGAYGREAAQMKEQRRQAPSPLLNCCASDHAMDGCTCHAQGGADGDAPALLRARLHDESCRFGSASICAATRAGCREPCAAAATRPRHCRWGPSRPARTTRWRPLPRSATQPPLPTPARHTR